MAEVNSNNKFKGKNKKFIKNMVESASPSQLVSLLYDGAMQWVLMAKQELKKNNDLDRACWTNYCHYIGMAVKIMTHLQETLDHSHAPEMADNLFNLYDFIKNNLLVANAKKQENLLDDAVAVIKEIKMSWNEGMKLLNV